MIRLHLEWNREAIGKSGNPFKQHALNTLWPNKRGPHGTFPGKCAMFHEKPSEKERPLFPEIENAKARDA